MERRDIVQEAVNVVPETREATGTVDGTDLRLKQNRVIHSDRSVSWRVTVETEDGNQERESGLDKPEADRFFEALVERHGLSEE